MLSRRLSLFMSAHGFWSGEERCNEHERNDADPEHFLRERKHSAVRVGEKPVQPRVLRAAPGGRRYGRREDSRIL